MTTDRRDLTGQDEYREGPTRSLRTTTGWLTFTAAVFLLALFVNVIAGRVL